MDTYRNYGELAAQEQEGSDFSVKVVDRANAKTLLLAPHGGAIEPGTSEIARAIAGDDLSYYLFEGIKSSNNRILHITSTNFDEPRALEIVEEFQNIVAVHGEGSEDEIVYLGGRDNGLLNHLKAALVEAGYTTETHTNPSLQGKSLNNICNRGCSSAGVQLEVARGLRRRFFSALNSAGRKDPTAKLNLFASAIRNGLQKANAL
ncbi:MAG: poly-gamma-glutamate hydrolase family protein [Candidatus Thiodiazotropha sp. (ex Epidulcina cf. delphinae)]|nr:poly-gamma-glutamate hydrolase family protein [Candidatus Thiodiazotropha sp. (ex Epidulcina cf. delphinae)]